MNRRHESEVIAICCVVSIVVMIGAACLFHLLRWALS